MESNKEFEIEFYTFYKTLAENQVDIPYEFAEVLNDNIFDLLITDKEKLNDEEE